jgi:hypothetical protein
MSSPLPRADDFGDGDAPDPEPAPVAFQDGRCPDAGLEARPRAVSCGTN